MSITDQVGQRGQVISQRFDPILQGSPVLGFFKKGGKVKKTGLYRLHRGETVAKLTAKTRNALPSSSFVFPKTRKFPIEDKSHARNALSRAGAKGGAVESKVRAAVHAKYPGIGPVSRLKRAQ